MRVIVLITLLLLVGCKVDEPMTPAQKQYLMGARARLGDIYDVNYYASGYPPKGRSACTDIVYFAARELGLDLQKEVYRNFRAHPVAYPAQLDRALSHRWCPNLMVWFGRTQITLPLRANYRVGDVLFWSFDGDEVPDHVGLISHRIGPRILHQGDKGCREEIMPLKWRVVGHYRFWRLQG